MHWSKALSSPSATGKESRLLAKGSRQADWPAHAYRLRAQGMEIDLTLHVRWRHGNNTSCTCPTRKKQNVARVSFCISWHGKNKLHVSFKFRHGKNKSCTCLSFNFRHGKNKRCTCLSFNFQDTEKTLVARVQARVVADISSPHPTRKCYCRTRRHDLTGTWLPLIQSS